MFYILDENKQVVKVDTLLEAAVQNQDPSKMRVALDTINGVDISTVFLGVDMNLHNYLLNQEPLVFETMIFGGDYDGQIDRCATWEDAEENHKRHVRIIKESMLPFSEINKEFNRIINDAENESK